MRQKFGALLCLALGGVLIFSGIDGSAAGSVGVAPINCGGDVQVGVANPGTCPTGTITLTEVTSLAANPAATPPSSWQVTVKSIAPTICNLPSTGTTQQVANNGGPISFQGLYIFQGTTTDTYCQYEITETAVAGFSAVFAPTAPYSFTYVPALTQARVSKAVQPRAFQGPSPLAVTLTNNATAPTTTASSSASSSSASSSPTGASSSAPTLCAIPTASGNAARARNGCVIPPPSRGSSAATYTVPASSSAALADTGPNRPIRPSLYLGIALCLLGVVLLFAGRRRPRGVHS